MPRTVGWDAPLLLQGSRVALTTLKMSFLTSLMELMAIHA